MQRLVASQRIMRVLAMSCLLLACAVERLQAQPAAPLEIPVSSSISPAAVSGSPEAPIPAKSLLAVIRDGGVLMIPILFCSFVLVVFVFERTVSLRSGRVIPRPFVRRFLEQLRAGQLTRDEAVKLCEENRSPVAQVFGAAVRKWGRPSVEIEQAILDTGERVTNELRRYVRVLSGVHTVSPMMGLLGTVLGMIQNFNAIVQMGAMGRPELLAAGIAQALLTTAAGLFVAIPALIAYLYFVSRVDRLVIQIDSLSQQVVDLISAEAQPNRGTQRSKAA
ncbi:MAG: MotA/TolQ/ExbB proton channel family protein [Pirellulaceae bacterium]